MNTRTSSRHARGMTAPGLVAGAAKTKPLLVLAAALILAACSKDSLFGKISQSISDHKKKELPSSPNRPKDVTPTDTALFHVLTTPQPAVSSTTTRRPIQDYDLNIDQHKTCAQLVSRFVQYFNNETKDDINSATNKCGAVKRHEQEFNQLDLSYNDHDDRLSNVVALCLVDVVERKCVLPDASLTLRQMNDIPYSATYLAGEETSPGSFSDGGKKMIAVFTANEVQKEIDGAARILHHYAKDDTPISPTTYVELKSIMDMVNGQWCTDFNCESYMGREVEQMKSDWAVVGGLFMITSCGNRGLNCVWVRDYNQ